MLGNPDLQTSRPVRILLFKNAKERESYPAIPPILDGRDRWNILLTAGAPVPRQVLRDCARLFLENNTGRMPACHRKRHRRIALHHSGERNARDTRQSASRQASAVATGRVCSLFATNPDYYAKLRILLYNLQKGADEDPAYLNSLGSRALTWKRKSTSTSPPETTKRPRWTPKRSAQNAIIRSSRCSRRKSAWRRRICLWAPSRREYRALIRENEYVAACV